MPIFVADELVTAAKLNLGTARDLATWTPTFTQSATITKTVTYAKYIQIGGLIVARFSLAATSAGTAGNIILVGLPVAAVSVNTIGGSFRYFDTGTTNYAGTIVGTSTTTCQFHRESDGNALGIGTPTVASGDAIEGTVLYFV